MRVKFWGVRGSTPVPEQGFLRYGGNTSCVELIIDSDHKIIFDSGTGIRNLGEQVSKSNPDKPLEFHIFFSHLHWDHTQGLPFFKPIFEEKNRVVFYGRKYENSKFYDKLKVLMGDIYFPVPFDRLPSQVEVIEINGDEPIIIGDTSVTAKHLSHPGGCLGFRVEHEDKVFTYATDNEHPKEGFDSNMMELAKDADILVYDGQYTPEEYLDGHVGWGHSTFVEGVKIAEEANVKKLVLFHHDPNHTDEFIDENIVAPAQALSSNVIAAQERLLLTL